MNQRIKQEISAGGVVFRISKNQKIKESEKYEFLIGKHSGYHKWVLPKGHIETGEVEQETAVREVEEELGVKARIVGQDPIKIIEYDFTADLDNSGETTRTVKSYQEMGGTGTKIHKKVIFYLMEVEGDLGQAGWEMEERKWVSYEEGMQLLAFETEREVLKCASDQSCQP